MVAVELKHTQQMLQLVNQLLIIPCCGLKMLVLELRPFLVKLAAEHRVLFMRMDRLHCKAKILTSITLAARLLPVIVGSTIVILVVFSKLR